MEEQNKNGGKISAEPKKGQEQDKEYDKKPSGEPTPDIPDSEKPGDIKPSDTIRDAKDRWDNESPAQKGQPNRIDPEPLKKDISEEEINPDVTNEELDEEDPDAHKNIK